MTCHQNVEDIHLHLSALDLNLEVSSSPREWNFISVSSTRDAIPLLKEGHSMEIDSLMTPNYINKHRHSQ
jgi:hypothetical protein